MFKTIYTSQHCSWTFETFLASWFFFFLVVISLKLTCYLQRASPVAHLVKNLPAKAGDARDIGLILESGKSPGEGNGNPLQYYHLENSMDRGAWWTIDHGVTKSRTQLSAHTKFYTASRTDLFDDNCASSLASPVEPEILFSLSFD